MAEWNNLMNAQINLAAIEAVEEAEILNEEGQRQFHPFHNPLEELSEKQFIRYFRLNKIMTEELIDQLQPHLTPPSRVSALCITRKVLTALRFFASGSYQLDIGSNLHLGVSQSSVSRCVTEISDALNYPDIMNRYIRFPRNYDELNRIRNEFYMQHQFPGVIGCIDCTHVAIFPPRLHDPIFPEAAYVNRKGYHSINVQLICDSNLKIMNVLARFPGSTHDNHIWQNSNVLPLLRNIYEAQNGPYYLLGDSGYALRPWLLTPVLNAAPYTPEAAYTERQRSCRSVIERCNGVLKLRFRCLLKHRVLHYTPTRASKIINACCVLHNMCIDHNLPPWQDEDDENIGVEVDLGMYEPHEGENNEQLVGNRVNPELAAGRRLQQQIIRNYFAV